MLPAESVPAAVFVGPVTGTGATSGDSENPDDAAAPSSAPYLSVPESSAFHGTLGTAQVIPDAPYVGVDGVFGATEPIDLYRVAIGPGALLLRLAPSYDQSEGAPPLRLFVFNALGRLLGTAAVSDGVADLSVPAGGSGFVPGSTVLVGVQSSAPVATNSAGIGYQLWFLRVPGVSSDALGLESLDPRGGDQAVVSVSASLSAGSGSAAGPLGTGSTGSSQLPALSAAPSGGVLSDSIPTRTVALAAVREDEPDGFGATPLGAEAIASEGEAPTSDGPHTAEPIRLVALRGPGGLPVFAAPAAGDWHAEPDSAADPTADPDGRVGCPTAPVVMCVGAASVVVATSSVCGPAAEDGVADEAAPRFAALSSVYVISAVNSPYLNLAGDADDTSRPRRGSTRARNRKRRTANTTAGSLPAGRSDGQ